ncbi:hypothetical protein GO755_00260 [Spirosoma sp. HMF4905]|uniref:Uncharacterized protein n=1 Tax=Spirosoma arboris TaxID=2682092 RepID=A0A7K1S3N8_9BACT|nr:hypothetical protein [Spirosoma arboris]MVM28443.1 hypothetical protein [Spirosoma arboris]
MRRSEKLSLLSNLVNGRVNTSALSRLKEKKEGFISVVSSDGEPALSDLVDTRLPDEAGRSRVPYGDFLKNPGVYGRQCITVD